MSEARLQIHIDLDGLPGRMQRSLKSATNLVSIGLRAEGSIDAEQLSLPSVDIVPSFDSNNPWSADEAKVNWRRWVLRNGFREIAETISSTLEEVHKVLSLWSLAIKQRDEGQLTGADWTSHVVQASDKFHRRTLPQKLDLLQRDYGFSLEPDLLAEAMSLNAARNCFVHREGVVTEMETQGAPAFSLRWRALVAFAVNGAQQVEMKLPYLVEAGCALGIGTRQRTKEIPLGARLDVSESEFAEICWGLLTLAQSAAATLQTYAKSNGLELAPKAN